MPTSANETSRVSTCLNCIGLGEEENEGTSVCQGGEAVGKSLENVLQKFPERLPFVPGASWKEEEEGEEAVVRAVREGQGSHAASRVTG